MQNLRTKLIASLLTVCSSLVPASLVAQTAPPDSGEGEDAPPIEQPVAPDEASAADDAEADEGEEDAAGTETAIEPVLQPVAADPAQKELGPETQAPIAGSQIGEGPPPDDGVVVEAQMIEVDAAASAKERSRASITAGADYRVRSLMIEPIELNGVNVRGISWNEQRGRLDLAARLEGVGALTFQADALDGVLFGDNGSFVGTPKANSGVSLSAKRPNLTRWELGLLDGGDPLNPDDYGPVLVEADLLQVNHLYADILLPVGLLRVGRQPLNYGAGITGHDGGRRNRWGVSTYSDSVDRILFGTKIDEAIRIISGGEGAPDLSADNGVLWALFYDFLKQDDVRVFSDDLRQIGTAVQWKAREADWLGLEWRNFTLAQNVVHLFNEKFDSSAFGFPFLFETEVENFRVELQYMYINGQTEEISEGFAALASKPPVRQKIEAHGARAVLDGMFGPVTATLEFNYASGDDDPRSSTPITAYSFSRDLNVGLLMFEHIIAFESARSVAVGIENLSGADVESFPLTEASTEGRFTNAIAGFPQIRIDWLQLDDHNIHTRLGGLFAWSAAPGGVVDPILTSIAEDGERIDDDAVNYHGGRPARFYGTEIDFQIGYTLRDHFHWVVEAAYLIPGPALQDENGDAIDSYLLENRFVVTF